MIVIYESIFYSITIRVINNSCDSPSTKKWLRLQEAPLGGAKRIVDSGREIDGSWESPEAQSWASKKCVQSCTLRMCPHFMHSQLLLFYLLCSSLRLVWTSFSKVLCGQTCRRSYLDDCVKGQMWANVLRVLCRRTFQRSCVDKHSKVLCGRACQRSCVNERVKDPVWTSVLTTKCGCVFETFHL